MTINSHFLFVHHVSRPHFKAFGNVEEHGKKDHKQFVVLDVIIGQHSRFTQLTVKADPDVPLETESKKEGLSNIAPLVMVSVPLMIQHSNVYHCINRETLEFVILVFIKYLGL